MEDGRVSVSWRITSSAEQLVKGPPQTLRMRSVGINTIRPKCRTLVFYETEISSAFSAPRLYGRMRSVRQRHGTTCSALKWPQRTFRCLNVFATPMVTKLSTSPNICHYTTLWNIVYVNLFITAVTQALNVMTNCQLRTNRSQHLFRVFAFGFDTHIKTISPLINCLMIDQWCCAGFRRLRRDLIEVFKIFKGFGDIKHTDFFTSSFLLAHLQD